MTTEMVDSVGSSVVMNSPVNSAKVPRTLLIRWRAVKPTVECEASRVQVPAIRPVSLSWSVMRCSLPMKTGGLI